MPAFTNKSFGVCIMLLLLLNCRGYVFGQATTVTISGSVKTANTAQPLNYANVLLKKVADSSFAAGTVTNSEGRFVISKISTGNYVLAISHSGYATHQQPLYVGSASEYLDAGVIELSPGSSELDAVTVTARQKELSAAMEKKTYSVSDNLTQAGGSVLQSLQKLPGITIQDGKIQLRGSENVSVLVDGNQTALTGFGNQSGLENIPASAIEKIEIINNPSARYDANGNAGIINIIFKKEKQKGFTGKIGLSTGLGALWERQENLPEIRPQYKSTPKINPSVSLNYRKNKTGLFFQADNLYTQTLNKNEFVVRTYNDGTVIRQQLKRNRNTNFFTTRLGADFNLNSSDLLTISGLFGSEKIIDRGDQPFFNKDLSQRLRLWQFLEDELKTTAMASAAYQHKFMQPGHQLSLNFNYTFHREDEKYFFDNILPTFTGKDAFKLISDEHVADLNSAYIKPLKNGRFETGLKFRWREIPTNMQFFPGLNSPIDSAAGGPATYKETIPAVYGTYVFDNRRFEAELGLRLEYVNINYVVGPNHPTYQSDGYHYTQPFPNLRLGFKLDEQSKLSLFYNRRVDRPNEVDIRIFPKYDDAEIIKVGNPALRPQFSNSFEAGYKRNLKRGSIYTALYYRMVNGTITRISSTAGNSRLIYAIFQNAGKSSNAGAELVFNNTLSKAVTIGFNANVYQNIIRAFTVSNLYPSPSVFTADEDRIVSGNAKLNATFNFAKGLQAQLTAIYLAPDLIPQGRIEQRFTMDAGLKKVVQKGKGEIFLNANDLFNTMVIKRKIRGNGFSYTSNDYYETQVVRLGYNLKF